MARRRESQPQRFLMHYPRRRRQLSLGVWAVVAAALVSGACGSPVEFSDADEDGMAGSPDGGSDGASSGGKKASGGTTAVGGTSLGGESSGDGGKAEAGGSSTSESGGKGGDDEGTGGAGTGGTVDPGVNGRPGASLVSLGARMKSSNYTVVLTMGETPGGHGFMSSKNYRLKGGLIATTEGD